MNSQISDSDSFYSACEDSDEFPQKRSDEFSQESRSSVSKAYSNGSSLNFQEQPLLWNSQPRLRGKDSSQIMLRLVQEIDISQFCISKTVVQSFSKDGRFLAIGLDTGHLLIFEVAPRQDQSQLLKSVPFKVFQEHQSSITSISWALSKNSDYSLNLLTASSDATVKLWALDQDISIATYSFQNEVAAVAFKTVSYFIAGGVDKSLRVCQIETRKTILAIQTSRKVRCLKFSPDRVHLVVGMCKGEVAVYKTDSEDIKFVFERNILCKNRRGFNSGGRDVTGIKFKDNDHVLVTTLDSRVRFLDINTGLVLAKFKGHKMKNFNTGAFISNEGSFVVNGSDNGMVNFWQFSGIQNELIKVNACESYSVRQKKTSEFLVIAPVDLVHYVRKHCLPIDNYTVLDIFISTGARSSLRVFYWISQTAN